MPRGKPKRTTLITKAAWLPLTRDVKTAQPALAGRLQDRPVPETTGPVNTYTHPQTTHTAPVRLHPIVIKPVWTTGHRPAQPDAWPSH